MYLTELRKFEILFELLSSNIIYLGLTKLIRGFFPRVLRFRSVSQYVVSRLVSFSECVK